MRDTIKKLLNIKNKAAGVSLFIKQNDQIVLSIVVVELNDNKVEVVQKEIKQVGEEEILRFIPTNIPIHISIDGKGIINRQINKIDSMKNEEIIHNIFPNASLKEFYLQKFNSQDFIYASLIRKSQANKLINKLIEGGIYPLSLTLGPFEVNTVLEFIHDIPEFVFTSNHKLRHEKGALNNFSRVEEAIDSIAYDISADEIENEYIWAFSCAINHYKGRGYIEIEIPLLEHSSKEFKNKKIYQKLGVAILVFFLGILLMNFFVYSSIQETNANLYSVYNQNEAISQDLEDLKNELEIREQMVDNLGLMTPSRFAFYCDQVSYHLPNRIGLNKLEINPLLRNLEEGEEPLFDYGLIYLSGYTSNSKILNDYIKKLRNLSWVKDINLHDFSQSFELKEANFTLQIEIK